MLELEDYQYNEDTLVGSILYAEKPFIDIDVCNRIFKYVPTRMLFSKRARKVYEIIQDLCKTEDVDLIGTKQFTDKIRMIASLEGGDLDYYVMDLYEKSSAISAINYWMKKVQKTYFSQRYKEASTEEEFLQIVEERQNLSMETDMVKASYKAEEDIEDYEREKGTAVFTPYPSINDAVGSLQGGDMIVLGATPGSGKTAMLLNMAVGMAKEGKKVDVFSLEMPMKQLRRRMICSLAEIDSSKFRKFELSEEEKNRYNQYATTEFDKLPIKIFKQQSVTVEYIKTIEMKSDSDIVFIDYLGLIDSYGNKASYEKFSEISRNIKLLAMQSNKPIVCLHQLNREIQNRDDKLPKISDLRDSGKIEQDADMIWFVHRPFCYDQTKSPEDMLFMVSKNRHGKNNVTIPMVFNGMHQKITEPMKV